MDALVKLYIIVENVHTYIFIANIDIFILS